VSGQDSALATLHPVIRHGAVPSTDVGDYPAKVGPGIVTAMGVVNRGSVGYRG
jgi:hypothetical protein